MLYPDAEMRLAVSRTIAIETSRGWRLAKEKTSHKIDAVVALAMGAWGANKFGEHTKRRNPELERAKAWEFQRLNATFWQR